MAEKSFEERMAVVKAIREKYGLHFNEAYRIAREHNFDLEICLFKAKEKIRESMKQSGGIMED